MAERSSMNQTLPKRNEISPEYKWAIEDLYENDDDCKKEMKEVLDALESLSTYEGHLLSSPDTLLSFLKEKDQISIQFERVYVYANQRYHEDTSNSIYQALCSEASSMQAVFCSKLAFEEPELLALTPKLLEDFCKAVPELSVYRIYLNNIIRQKSHIRSQEIEALLADAQDMAEGASNIFSMFNNADLKFPSIKDDDGNEIPVTHGRYTSLLESANRNIRRQAFTSLYSMYKTYENTLAAAYSTNLKQEYFFASARNYSSSLEMALDGGEIPIRVYHNLIDTVHKYLPLLHRYVRLRKEMLGLDELHMYDLYTPMLPRDDKKIPFEEAKKIVLKGLAPLGEEYLSRIQEGFDNRWIDVYESDGKRSGAYSWGAYGTHPYVLLNYQENLNNVFTLAHEMGHSLHSYYSDATQPYVYAGYRIFVAEVASTCNESLLMDFLLNKEDNTREEKLFLLNYFMEQFRGTLYRQTMFAEFELITHEMIQRKEPLTAQKLNEIYYGLNQTYFGKDIIIDEEIGLEWARIPHFYTPFYVYQYATGYSAAIAISQKILKKEPNAVNNYLKFLSSGSSKNCIDLLKICGVDMTQTKPVESALDLFASLLDRFEEIATKKI
ncbi:MAG: oligoendopeptidase F [Lachnospiraceae bacterium]|nr:oligoendopeptidase F [Lachnospiraceae bacterium]